ncbi:hypothetical protein Tco_1500141 [Tanacetum coccineum]
MSHSARTYGLIGPDTSFLQMLWGIITSTNVDYAELMWEEFVQAIQTFLTDKGQSGQNAPYYNAYLEMVAKHDRKIVSRKKTGKGKEELQLQATQAEADLKINQSKPGTCTEPKADSFILGVSVSKHIKYSEEFVNVFMRIGFDSTIELVSFDKSQVVTFNGKFVFGFRNGDCETGSRSDNTVSSPHGFVIHGIEVLKGNEKVMEVIDVENWRVDNSRLTTTTFSSVLCVR